MKSDTPPEPDKRHTAQPAEPTATAGTEIVLTAEHKALIEGWEKAHGRRMTEQEIRLGVELWNSTVGEL